MANRNKGGRQATQTLLRPCPQSATSSPCDAPPPPECTSARPYASADTSALKLELLAEMRKEIADIFKTELRAALGEDLSTIKSELQAVKTQLTSDRAATDVELGKLKGTVGEMELSLSTCTDDIVAIQDKIATLSADMTKLENKCEDLEARSRRNNIRIVGVPEEEGNISTVFVAALLKEAFSLDKEPLLDRCHRTLQSKPRAGERPRAIVARLHYHSDCIDILRRAREHGRINIRNMAISIFPDYTAKIARARAMFNDIRRQLRGMEGVRYGLVHPARLRISYDGVEKVFQTPDEAHVFIKKIHSGANAGNA